MGSGAARIAGLSDIEFAESKDITRYARANQKLAHDIALELDNAALAAAKAMEGLDGHHLLLGVDVKLRAWRVAKHLRRARDLAQGISAESVKFNAQYNIEFFQDIKPGHLGKGGRGHRKGVEL